MKKHKVIVIVMMMLLLGSVGVDFSAEEDSKVSDTLTYNDIFLDDNLAICVANQVGGSGTSPTDSIDIATLNSVKRLECASQNISSIDGIENMTSLENLEINGNSKIQDISSLAELTNLDTLNIGFNDITDITPLSGLTNLTWLAIDSNPVTDLTPISGLSKLESFHAVGNGISDITPLSSLTTMKELNLSYNNIEDISSLSSMSKLNSLEVNNNKLDDEDLLSIKDILFVDSSTGLPAALDISSNNIMDISSLQSLIDSSEYGIYFSANNETYSRYLDSNEISGPKTVTGHSSASITSEAVCEPGTIDMTLDDPTLWSYDPDKNIFNFPTPIVVPSAGYFKANYDCGAFNGEITIYDKTSLETNDETIYVGDSWVPGDTFISATDVYGNNIPLESIDVSDNVDTSKAGVYEATYSFNTPTGVVSKTATITVLGKETLEVKDETIYVGDSWVPADTFVSATDKDGNPLTVTDVVVSGAVDTTKAGVYEVTYTNGTVEKVATITVLDDKSTLEVKDETIYVGDSWVPADTFVSATDSDGKNILLKNIKVSDNVDASKVGVYQANYSFNSSKGLVSKTASITVIDKGSTVITDGGSIDGKSNIVVTGIKNHMFAILFLEFILVAIIIPRIKKFR